MTNQIQISMNYKNILIRLHTKFPQFDTDTLIEILNCMEESTPIEEHIPAVQIVSSPGTTWRNDALSLEEYNGQLVPKNAETTHNIVHN